ncbi:Transcription termination protein NusB [Indibacter alkaliphilus LW1]|uniref:Transcription termination protein NusB n=1 Tax=Indibacter alkaliphilus (strain CCUG 57479 / KCTC 22604 / LW1) TaxID=1189612 RepID=S2DLW2_INDAL|nr:transcription antitermination factor NusB [Indibacter alkaliphilus]EPA00070.1 Transcription termination protein NusB [Indibacter alkaliphilus LW1]
MLNRRILRVKAFQNLYAYEQCKASNFNLAKDQIKDAFLPDLNSMEVQDKGLLKKEAALATELFIKNLNTDTFEAEKFSNPKITVEAKKAINAFHQANRKDFEFLANNMVSSAERLPQLYLYSIQILLAFRDHVEKESERKKKMSQEAVTLNKSDLNLSNNKILLKIKDSETFNNAITRNGAYIDELELEIKEWFRDYVRPLDSYKSYIQITDPSLEEDFEIADDILKKVIFKIDAILNFFSEKDLNWTENKSIVRSLASKVLKNIKEQYSEEEELLPEIALNWEDDKEFFQNIFNLTVQNDDHNKDLIAKRTQNWDIERIAQTDKIILSMAITEMKKFPSIPVKVSINEYIDISKTYSTPKSKQFVNGLLDVLSKELTENGQIRKSGRGLLDNK